jgi:acetyl-CoA C-acetyltransferase
MENMSAAPHMARGLRVGVKLGDITLIDSMVADGLTCAFQSCHMGMHAEHVARKFSINREQMDQYAVSSQQRAAAAIADGVFVDEIVPVVVQQGKSSVIVEQYECPRPATTLEGLAKLRPVFDSAGAVTAGNASAISDGAAAVVVSSESEASNSPWKFRILASHTSGTEPEDLFIAPVAAIQGALQIANLSIDDIDLFEINEAFASQMLACVQALKLKMNRVNIRGGGISLGHPIGASGARVLVTLIHALLQTNQQRGVASLCLGGGNAVAMVIERVAD